MIYIATVVGRNRRVYSRVYKRNNGNIERMAEHYRQMEKEKSSYEGFRVTGLQEIGPFEGNGVCTRVFQVQYEAAPVPQIINISVDENDYDPEFSRDGGSYRQPHTVIEFSDGSVMEIDDSSCGDFGSRIDVRCGDRAAHYGTMLSDQEFWSDFHESDIPMLRAVYERTGYRIPVM